MGQNSKYDDPDDPKFYDRQQRYDDAEFELLVLRGAIDTGGRPDLAATWIQLGRLATRCQ